MSDSPSRQEGGKWAVDATGLVNDVQSQQHTSEGAADYSAKQLHDQITDFASSVQSTMSTVHASVVTTAMSQVTAVIDGSVTMKEDNGNQQAEGGNDGDDEEKVEESSVVKHSRDTFLSALLDASLSQQQALLRASEAAVLMERADVRRIAAEETTRTVVAASANIAKSNAVAFDQSDAVKTALTAKASTLEETASQLVGFVARSVQMSSDEVIAATKTRATLDFRIVQLEVELNRMTAKHDVSNELLCRSDVRVDELMNMIKILSDERDELGELPRMLAAERKLNHKLESMLNLQGIATAVVRDNEDKILQEQETRQKKKISFEDTTTTTPSSSFKSKSSSSLRPLLNTFPIYPSPINLPSNLSLVTKDPTDLHLPLRNFGPDLMALKIVQKQKFTISELVKDWETKYHEVEQLKQAIEVSEKERFDVCVQLKASLAALAEERRRRKLEEQWNQKLSLERAGGVTGRLNAIGQVPQAALIHYNQPPPLFERAEGHQANTAHQGTVAPLTTPSGDMRAIPVRVSANTFRSVPFDAEESAHTISCLHERLNNCHDETVALQARVAELFSQKKSLAQRCEVAETKTMRLEEEHQCSRLVASVEAAKSEYTKDRNRLRQMLLETKERLLHSASANQVLQTRLDEVSTRVRASEELSEQLSANLEATTDAQSELEKTIKGLQNENSRLWEQLSTAQNSLMVSDAPAESSPKVLPWGGAEGGPMVDVAAHVETVNSILQELKYISVEALTNAKEAAIRKKESSTNNSSATSTTLCQSSSDRNSSSSKSDDEQTLLRGALEVVFAQLRTTDKVRTDMNDSMAEDIHLQQELLSELVQTKIERDESNQLIKKLGSLISRHAINVTELILSDDSGLVGSPATSSALRTLHDAISQNRSDDDTVFTVTSGDAACTDAVRSVVSAAGGEHQQQQDAQQQENAASVDPQQYRVMLRVEEMSALQTELELLKQKEQQFERERRELEKSLALSEQELSMKEFWLTEIQTQLKKTDENSHLLRRENAELSHLLREQIAFSASQKYVSEKLMEEVTTRGDDGESDWSSSDVEGDEEDNEPTQPRACLLAIEQGEEDGDKRPVSSEEKKEANENDGEERTSTSVDRVGSNARAAENEEKGYFFQDDVAGDDAEEDDDAEQQHQGNSSATASRNSPAKKKRATTKKPRTEASKQRRRLQKSLNIVHELLTNTFNLDVFTNLASNQASSGGTCDEEETDTSVAATLPVSHLASFQHAATVALSDLTAQLRQCVDSATSITTPSTHAAGGGTAAGVVANEEEEEGTTIPTNPSEGAENAIQHNERREKDRIIAEAFKDIRNTPVFKQAIEEEGKLWKERETSLMVEGTKRKEAVEKMLAMNKDLLDQRKVLQSESQELKAARDSATQRAASCEAALKAAEEEFLAEKRRYESIIAQVAAAPAASSSLPSVSSKSTKGGSFQQTSTNNQAPPHVSSTTKAEVSPRPVATTAKVVATPVAAPVVSLPTPTIVATTTTAEEEDAEEEEEEEGNNPFAFGGSPFEAIVGKKKTAFAEETNFTQSRGTTATSTTKASVTTTTSATEHMLSMLAESSAAEASSASNNKPSTTPSFSFAKQHATTTTAASIAPKAMPPTKMAATTSASVPTPSPSPFVKTTSVTSPFAALAGKTPTSFGTAGKFPSTLPTSSAATVTVPKPSFAVPQVSISGISGVAAAAPPAITSFASKKSAAAGASSAPSLSSAPTTPATGVPTKSSFAAKARRSGAAAAAAAPAAARAAGKAPVGKQPSGTPPTTNPPPPAFGGGGGSFGGFSQQPSSWNNNRQF